MELHLILGIAFISCVWSTMIGLFVYILFCRSPYRKEIKSFMTRERLYILGQCVMFASFFVLRWPPFAIVLIVLGVSLMLYNLPKSKSL